MSVKLSTLWRGRRIRVSHKILFVTITLGMSDACLDAGAGGVVLMLRDGERMGRREVYMKRGWWEKEMGFIYIYARMLFFAEVGWMSGMSCSTVGIGSFWKGRIIEASIANYLREIELRMAVRSAVESAGLGSWDARRDSIVSRRYTRGSWIAERVELVHAQVRGGSRHELGASEHEAGASEPDVGASEPELLASELEVVAIVDEELARFLQVVGFGPVTESITLPQRGWSMTHDRSYTGVQWWCRSWRLLCHRVPVKS